MYESQPRPYRFDAYLAELVTSCREHPLITGLVLMGSTADRARVDEWSDHDFAVIAEADQLEYLRGDLSWLPRAATIVASAREHHDGFKVIYDDGAVIEFAVTDLRRRLAPSRSALSTCWPSRNKNSPHSGRSTPHQQS